ncbi:centrosomal protein of 97 kDa isoform X1 [Carcharodon carcharias]|uniref:centrosomal protein of 97 kDa isoform X1 n=1 Tax=Carcharodon carcharias TaxID=13397 RepID=UPI001B7F17A0|nr:centrosomal protein of 97 kDa isoform X1 [Carcharodon carcharias]
MHFVRAITAANQRLERLLGVEYAGSCCVMAAGKEEASDMTVKAAESRVVDLSGMGLQHLDTISLCVTNAFTLILDKNQLTKLESVEKCSDLVQLSVANNRLVRMIGVAKLISLQVLNLPNNSIGNVEGLKDLVHLEWLNLAGNNIKTMEPVNSCLALRHLDLSDNNISLIGDLSKLLSLQILLLHGNTITTLRSASSHLPPGLNILSLAENEIRDLNEVSYLGFLRELEQLSIMSNPCVMATPSLPGFDYRPYIVSWCLTLRILDGYVIPQKESLKAEWLYSQGKGRSFRPGQHVQLVQYLASVCPLTSTPALQSAEDAKLEKILNKQRLHQMELMEKFQNSSHIPQSSPTQELSFQSERNSLTQNSSTHNVKEPVIRINSWVGASDHGDQCHAVKEFSPVLGQTAGYCCSELFLEDVQTDEDKLNCSLLSSESMFMPVTAAVSPLTPSHDLSLPRDTPAPEGDVTSPFHLEKGAKHKDSHDRKHQSATRGTEEYGAWGGEASKKSKVSGNKLFHVSSPVQSCVNFTSSISKCPESAALRKEHNLLDNKLPKWAPMETSQKMVGEDSKPDKSGTSVTLNPDPELLNEMNKAAIKIQAHWRGFYTRNSNQKAKEIRCEIRLRRMQEHVEYLTEEVIRWRKECKEERIQRMVQEEAVKFLWNQVQSLQEWQMCMTQKENVALHSDTKEPILPQHMFIHSSECEPQSFLLNSHLSPTSRQDTHLECSLLEFPDSGFQSSDVTHNCLKDSLNSHQSSSGSMSTVVEVSREIVRKDNECLTKEPGEPEALDSSHTQCSKENSNSEQDSSLIQQYLNSVRQLDAAEDEPSFSGRTECNSSSDVSLCGASVEMSNSNTRIPEALRQAEKCVIETDIVESIGMQGKSHEPVPEAL